MFANRESSKHLSGQLTIDEIRWLDASTALYCESPPPVALSPGKVSPANDLGRNVNPISDHYKSSLSLRCILTPPTPIPTPPPRSPSRPKSQSQTEFHSCSSHLSSHEVPPLPPTPPRCPEWIYRRPKSPRSRAANPTSFDSSPSRARTQGQGQGQGQGQDPPLWSIRPRSKADRVITSLHSSTREREHIIEVQPYVSPTKSSPINIKAPTGHDRTASMSSSIASTSASTSTLSESSRPPTPTTSSVSSSLPNAPKSKSKSILTRTDSISTKNSAATKSVKFVDMPVVHYAADADASFWDVDVDGTQMPFYSSSTTLPSATAATTNQVSVSLPSPGLARRESGKTIKGLGRFRLPGRKSTSPPPTKTTTTSHSNHHQRPSISGPFVLGYPPPTPVYIQTTSDTGSIRSARSGKSFRSRITSHGTSGGPGQGRFHGSLRSAPSMESFKSGKSGKSLGGRSVKSLGASVKSDDGSTGRYRFGAWLGRFGIS